MKLKEILKDIDVLYMTASPETEIGGICYDSRKAEQGDLFVAVTGFESDGHRFINSAVDRGAAAVICQRAPDGDVPYVMVADSRCALAAASASFYGHPADKMKIIGVTGTNGKTTSTILIKQVLEKTLGAKVGLIGTNGNMIGEKPLETERTTPESLELHKLFREMLDAGCSHVVMEVSSHSLVLDRVAGIYFELGLFTNLTRDHLDFHGSMEEYAEAKAKLFSQCAGAVINYDDAYAGFMSERAKCPVISFSADSNNADLVAKDIKLFPDSIKFCAVSTGEIERISLGIPGRFSVYNALGVIACCRALGVPLHSCAEALAGAGGVKGRMETVPVDGDYTVLIDYSHTPDALENVLKSVRETSSGRIVVLFGCGGDRDKTKRPIMGEIATELADFAIITSDNPRTEDPEEIIREILGGVSARKSRYIAITDREKAIEYAIKNHRPGDVIILAGKGHETYQEINRVKRHMDEREIVADILSRNGD